MMILYGLDLWTAMSPLLTPRWQQGMASLKRLLSEIGSVHVITLYGFGAGFGLPEISPFVTKTEVQLKMAGLAYRKEKAMPPASPKGQLPYIVDEAESIANSTFIRAHIEGKYGFDFDAPLESAGARAGLGVRAHDRTPRLLGAGRRALGRSREFCQGADAFLRRRARASARKAARGRAIPRRRELSAERSRPPRPGRGRRPRHPLAVCAVGAAWRQAVSDGRNALRHRCHRIRRAGRNPDAVLRLRNCASGPSNSEISPPMSTA